MPKPYDQRCPIARTLDIIGDRWTMLILRDLFMGKARFTDFLDSLPGIPTGVLSHRLKKLEEHGLVSRVVYSQHPLRAEYRLTDKGESLSPVLDAIVQWGMDHCFDEDPEARNVALERIAAARPSRSS